MDAQTGQPNLPGISTKHHRTFDKGNTRSTNMASPKQTHELKETESPPTLQKEMWKTDYVLPHPRGLDTILLHLAPVTTQWQEPVKPTRVWSRARHDIVSVHLFPYHRNKPNKNRALEVQHSFVSFVRKASKIFRTAKPQIQSMNQTKSLKPSNKASSWKLWTTWGFPKMDVNTSISPTRQTISSLFESIMSLSYLSSDQLQNSIVDHNTQTRLVLQTRSPNTNEQGKFRMPLDNSGVQKDVNYRSWRRPTYFPKRCNNRGWSISSTRYLHTSLNTMFRSKNKPNDRRT